MSNSCDTACAKAVAPPITEMPVTQEEVDIAGQTILAAMNASPSCSTSQNINVDPTISTTVSAIIPLVGVTKTGAIDSTATTVGCEQLTVAAVRFVQTKKSIMQVLNCVCTNLDLQAAAINNFDLVAYNSELKCNVVVNQTINVKMVATNEVTNEIKQEIQRVTTEFISMATDALLATKTEAGAVVQGQKAFSSVSQELNSEETTQQISENITKMMQTATTGNTIRMEIHDSILSGSQCTFDQDIVLNLVATNILSSVMDTFFKSDSFTAAMTEIKQSTEQEATGVATIVEEQGKAAAGSQKLMIIAGIIVAVIILIIIIIIASKK